MSEETEILSDVEALRDRFSDTKTLYREVCALLFFRHGITPTTNKLYQYVRKGTMSTPAEALAKFWDDLRSKARVEIDHPDLPPEVKTTAANAVAEIWRHATAAARDELAAIRIEMQADQERLRHDRAQAEQVAAQTQLDAQRLREQLSAAEAATRQTQAEFEAERRAHVGAIARLQELQSQLEQARAQQQRMQEAFSADLAAAREAVEAADRRSAASDKRALLEIEQERQARSKVDKLVESLRAQLGQVEQRERQAELAAAETAARLQSQHSAAVDAHRAAATLVEQLRGELDDSRRLLTTSREEVSRYRAEAETSRALVERLAPGAAPPSVNSPPPAAKSRRKPRSEP
jgi:hypothetical protein